MEDPHVMTLLTAIATVLLFGVQTGNPSDFVIMQFSAKWCEPCKEMDPAIEELSKKGWIIRSVDVDLEKSIVQRMRVTHLPTLLVLKDGREIERITGVYDFEELTKLLPSASSDATVGTLELANATPGLEPFPLLQDSPTTNSRKTRTQPSPAPAPPATARQSQNPPPIDFEQTEVSPIVNPRIPVDPMSTTVRIKIEDDSSIAFGTGTMIDQVNGEVLVLTCGHMFRDLKTTSRISVEAPVNGQLGQFGGTVIDYKCDETDIGLLSFKADVKVPTAILLPRGATLREGEAVVSFGCDGGADPTRRDSQITKLNRYLGPSNVEVAVAPVQGRSGGGLFNQKGQLIGVCYAADSELDEGLYSGPEVVYGQLARLGLSRLYSEPANGAQSFANTLPSNPTDANVQLASSNIGSPKTGDAFPDQLNLSRSNRAGSNGNQPWKETVDHAAQVAQSNATAIAAASDTLLQSISITATIRDASGRERTVSIPNPSPALLQMLDTSTQLANASNATQAGTTASLVR